MKDIEYWTQAYNYYRKTGEFIHADSLREMLRRMGYEIKTDDKGAVYWKEV